MAKPKNPEELLKKLDVFAEPDVLNLALMHRSYAYEHGGIPTNERLEFLGDSILGFTVADLLYKKYPEYTEGQLAKTRAAVVSTSALATAARQLQIGQYIWLGHGESRMGGGKKDSILADTLEALIGAVYLSSGMETAQKMIASIIEPLLANADVLRKGQDWKTNLQEKASHMDVEVSYDVKVSGPDHARKYTATAFLTDDTGSQAVGHGSGTSKKMAEQEAARTALVTVESKESAETKNQDVKKTYSNSESKAS